MTIGLCWLRRDLRWHDHRSLAKACAENAAVHVVFVFDPLILERLPSRSDARLHFIYDSLLEMEAIAASQGASIHILHGDPVTEIPRLVAQLQIDHLYFNRDYEPYAKARDTAVAKEVRALGAAVRSFKDQVGFEQDEVRTGQDGPFQVFTPYRNKWLAVWADTMREVPCFTPDLSRLAQWHNPRSIALHDWWQVLGFAPCPPSLPAGTAAGLARLQTFRERVGQYHKTRDFPARDGTSHLSVDLRHGTISVRDALRLALAGRDEGRVAWTNELIWRDFYQTVLDVWPHVVDGSFKPEYDAIAWQGSDAHFAAWCQGMTGVPVIDAAMRCLAATGQMPNRLRMVVGQFLCKTLLLDWRRGEAWFAAKLLDFDLAANNGGWQWCSSSGCDAAPYFRIFNPYLQSQKFDAQGAFLRQWCPELRGLSAKQVHRPEAMTRLEQVAAGCVLGEDYPWPLVDYAEQRTKAIAMYQAALQVGAGLG